MSSQYAHPKWWQLYLTFPLLIGLFILDNRLKLSLHGHQVLQIGIMVLVYGLIHFWIKANARAFSEMDQARHGNPVRVIMVSTYQFSYTNGENHKHPMLQMPDSGIKGTLSDTFEMDVIDAEFFSVDEIAQNSKKE